VQQKDARNRKPTGTPSQPWSVPSASKPKTKSDPREAFRLTSVFASPEIAAVLLAGYNFGQETRIMTVEQAISDISSLPFDDQLKVVQAIWDRLPESSTLALSDAARSELARRVANYTADPTTLMTENQLRARMRSSDT
jgi:putative addiction module component (TIGR02574 family)